MEKETRQRAEKRRAEVEAAKAAALQRATAAEAAAKFDAKEKLTSRMMVRLGVCVSATGGERESSISSWSMKRERERKKKRRDAPNNSCNGSYLYTCVFFR